MKNANRFTFYFLLVNIVTCCYFFFPVIGSLNRMMVSLGGDGMKNYFTYLYFVKYNQGTLFTGMNYPFGENMVFTDNTPVLAWTLVQLKNWFPHIADYSLFFLHSFMMLSYLLCATFIYKILKLFNVMGWWAILSAVFIAYFSPQIMRAGGHFSLSLACYLPMIIYWMMQYQRKPSFKYLSYIFLGIVFFTFCHVYFLAMALILIAAFVVAYFLVQKASFRKKIIIGIPLLLTVIAAIITFKLFLYFTDHVTDRPQYPIGFLGAKTSIKEVITSAYNFIAANIFTVFFDGPSFATEGYNYIGIINVLLVLFLLFRILKSIVVRIKSKSSVPTHPVRAYRVWLLTAFFCLIFAMGIPFIWGLEFLSEYIASLRQFRSIGRFAWIFYYLITVYSAIVLYRGYYFYRRSNLKLRWLHAIAFLIVVINFIELNGYAQELDQLNSDSKENYKTYFSTGEHNWKNYLTSIGYPPDKFQSFIVLPYFHIGSEQLAIQNVGEGYTMIFGSQLAMQSGLSMTNVMMSRTSWSQTYEQVSLIDGLFSPKPILNRFNKKPVLLLVSEYEKLKPGEAWLVEQSKLISGWAGFILYETNVDTILSRKKRQEDSLLNMVSTDGRKEGLLKNETGFTFYHHFEALHTPHSFLGAGAFTPNTSSKQEEMLTIPVTHPTKDTSFIFSAWLKCIPNSEQMPYIFTVQYDASNKKIYECDFISGTSTYKIENWFKAERVITIKENTKYIKLYAMCGPKNLAAIDEILVHPLNTHYFYKYSDSLWLIDNRPVKMK